MQMALSKFIALKFPDVIFTAEASGVRTSYVQAAKMKMMRSTGSHLDMIILEPRGLYAGLILELKDQSKSPFLLDGSLSKTEHVQAQAAMINRLKKKGYFSAFAVGLDQAMAIIYHYMNQPTFYGFIEQRQQNKESISENGR